MGASSTGPAANLSFCIFGYPLLMDVRLQPYTLAITYSLRLYLRPFATFHLLLGSDGVATLS
jgi:hypothetical protein